MGEIAGGTTGFLDDEGTIHIQFTYGFGLNTPSRVTLNIGDNQKTRTQRAGFIGQRKILLIGLHGQDQTFLRHR